VVEESHGATVRADTLTCAAHIGGGWVSIVKYFQGGRVAGWQGGGEVVVEWWSGGVVEMKKGGRVRTKGK
jgi:hypothetical protein